MSEIRVAGSDAEIKACFPVMHELRPLVEEAEFVARVRRQMAGGYQMVFLEEDGAIRAVAGFRFYEVLMWGPLMYVDDLVVREADRGKGYGGMMLEWLIARARSAGCAQFHLDSGTHRIDAHRFYQQHGMKISSYHFSLVLEGE